MHQTFDEYAFQALTSHIFVPDVIDFACSPQWPHYKDVSLITSYRVTWNGAYPLPSELNEEGTSCMVGFRTPSNETVCIEAEDFIFLDPSITLEYCINTMCIGVC